MEEAFEVFKNMPWESARGWFEINQELVKSWFNFENVQSCPNFWQVPLPQDLVIQCTRLPIPDQICLENWCEEVAIEFVITGRFQLIPQHWQSAKVQMIFGLCSNFFGWIKLIDRTKILPIVKRIVSIHLSGNLQYVTEFVYRAIAEGVDIELNNDSNFEHVPLLWELMKRFQPDLDLGDRISLIDFIKTNFEKIDVVVLANVFVRFWPDCFSVIVKAKKIYSRNLFRKLGRVCMGLGFQVIQNWDQICLKQCQSMPWRDVANGLTEGWFGWAAVSFDMMKNKTVSALVSVRAMPRIMTPELSDSLWFWKHYFMIHPDGLDYFFRFASARIRKYYNGERVRFPSLKKSKTKRLNKK